MLLLKDLLYRQWHQISCIVFLHFKIAIVILFHQWKRQFDQIRFRLCVRSTIELVPLEEIQTPVRSSYLICNLFGSEIRWQIAHFYNVEEAIQMQKMQ